MSFSSVLNNICLEDTLCLGTKVTCFCTQCHFSEEQTSFLSITMMAWDVPYSTCPSNSHHHHFIHSFIHTHSFSLPSLQPKGLWNFTQISICLAQSRKKNTTPGLSHSPLGSKDNFLLIEFCNNKKQYGTLPGAACINPCGAITIVGDESRLRERVRTSVL